jgi:eukaryotic-like serine/threonine-protein kinase
MAPARNDRAGDTLPAEDAEGELPSSAPVANWDRYDLLQLLGEGGMGSVYKARDRRLDRVVAIKFLRGADPSLTLRFLREARTQALIDHPHICRIYEVGEIDGRAYLALQLIDGEPLHRAAARLSLDDKLAVMRDVAAAIEEAHRRGVVHRDLKPANIMVERSAAGRWSPVVMDFGLAREATVEPGLTASGALLGTPAYMSPEQARGDAAVDHRADIYGLGATLYELVTGRPPFGHASLAQTLAQVIHDEPTAPRRLVPELPIDLETVVLKCLAKDPAQRYGSARLLADDLARCHDGEPIRGRRVSLWQRVRRRARRQRALVVLGAWSLAIIAALAALGVRAWLTSRDERALTAGRTRLAEQLGSQTKEIELWLHSAYQRPLHDTRPDRARVRAQMAAIRQTPHGLGALGDAAIHAALGRGHLALHDWRDADAELARAAGAGLDTPELHAARGRALGELYHRALEAARRSGDPAWLAGRQRALAQQYLTPALAELELARPSGDDAALVAALIALYRRDFAGAEQLAGALAARAPWLDEAARLAGDAAYGAAGEAFDRGAYDAAGPALDRATALYASTAEIARSDASVYEAAAQAWLQRAEVDYRRGGVPREPLQHAGDAIDRALVADPDDAAAYTTKAFVLLRRLRTPALVGPGAEVPLLDQMAQVATRAVEVDPRDARAWDALGNAHIYRGVYEAEHSGQDLAWWHRAIDELGKAVAADPEDPWAHNDLGAAHRWLGDHLERTGGDAVPEYQAALRSFERAAALDPAYVFAWCNQADIRIQIADHDVARGIDPRPALDGVQRAGERALAIDPNYYSLLDTLAQAQLTLAQYLTETGGDPAAALARAGGYLDRAAAVQRDNMATWFYRLVAAEIDARLAVRERREPTRAIAAARAALRETVRLAPSSTFAYVEAAKLDLVEAAWATPRGSAAGSLARARADAERAIALHPAYAEARLVAAEAYLQTATAQRARDTIDRGIAHVDRALALHPGLPRAEAVRAALVRLRDAGEVTAPGSAVPR